MSKINFLGYVFSAEGKAVDPDKTSAILQMAPPNTVHELQRWLGAVNYYSVFIAKYAEITAPLTDLLKGSSATKKKKCVAKLPWADIHQSAFETIRAELASPPVA